MILIFEKHPPFECIYMYTESFPLLRESFAYLLDPTLHKNPCPGDHEIYNFGRTSLGHLYYTRSLYEPCTRIKKSF